MKTIQSAMAVSFAMLVGGCMTTSEIREGTPARQFTSNKDAKTLGVCIADKWEAIPGGPKVGMRPSKSGYVISVYDFMSMNNTIFVAEVEDKDGGSVGRLYKGAVLGGGKFEAAIDICR